MMVASLGAQQKMKEKDLPSPYQDFLTLTRYIIKDKELDVFLQLQNNRERDAFIEMFWKIRDPTSGTSQNEYKEEHLRRFDRANTYYGRSTVRPGWMTDQGKFYIILGEPSSIERFEMTIGIYPVEVWSFYGDVTKGLPPHFVLVFWKKGGIGDWRLYDPVSDGPGALMIHSKGIAIENYEEFYDQIREMAPTLALVTLSMIPGEIPYNYQPSPRNMIILKDIIESPSMNINPSYATHFLDYKGMVSSEYMTNFKESDAHVALIKDPVMGINFLHFTIAPKEISIDYYQPRDQYFCNFTMNASLRRSDEDIIFQYTREFPFYFDPDDIERVRSNGIAIEDAFPVINGRYKMIVLLQNSVGKEFCLLEKDVFIPDDTPLPRLSVPQIGYSFNNYDPNLFIPFKILDKKLLVDPKNTFSSDEDISFFSVLSNVSAELWEKGLVRVEVRGLKPVDPINKMYTIRLSAHTFRRILTLRHTIPSLDLTPDYYELKLTLFDETGEAFEERKGHFVVSPAKAVAHPISHSKGVPMTSNFLFFFMQANQYEKVDNFELAEASYRKAYSLQPDYIRGLLDYGNFLLKVKKFEESLAIVESIKDNENLQFDYNLMKGKGLLGLERYKEALTFLLEGNKIYNSDIGLLNSLGLCYDRLGQFEEALKVLNSSIRLDPEQEAIKALIETIKAKIK